MSKNDSVKQGVVHSDETRPAAEVVDPTVDTRAEFAKGLEGEQQADNLGPVPPAGFVSEAIGSQYAEAGEAGYGVKPKFNVAILTSWDEQHPADGDPSKDRRGADVHVVEAAVADQVEGIDATRPITEPKPAADPKTSTDEDGRPVEVTEASKADAKEVADEVGVPRGGRHAKADPVDVAIEADKQDKAVR